MLLNSKEVTKNMVNNLLKTFKPKNLLVLGSLVSYGNNTQNFNHPNNSLQNNFPMNHSNVVGPITNMPETNFGGNFNFFQNSNNINNNNGK